MSSSGAESVAKRQRENKEEKKVQPKLYTMHAKHVITIPKDIPADETIIITSEDDIIITDNEIKRQKQMRIEDSTTQMNSMHSI